MVASKKARAAVGHVHAAFTEIEPEGVEENMVELNRDMLERVEQRSHFRSLWKSIGEPYHPEPILAVEKKYGGGNGFKPMSPLSQEWTEGSLTQAIGRAVIGGLAEAELLENMSWNEAEQNIHAAERAGGYVRIFLENADEDTSRMFAQAMADVFGPVADARYVIQRKADFEYSESRFKDTWILDKTPEFISQFIEKRTQVTKRRREVLKVHAVPKILARNKEMFAPCSSKRIGISTSVLETCSLSSVTGTTLTKGPKACFRKPAKKVGYRKILSIKRTCSCNKKTPDLSMRSGPNYILLKKP